MTQAIESTDGTRLGRAASPIVTERPGRTGIHDGPGWTGSSSASLHAKTLAAGLLLRAWVGLLSFLPIETEL